MRVFTKDNDAMSVQHIAAKNVCCALTKADVELLMEDLRISLAGCTTVLMFFLVAINGVCQVSDEKVMEI